jgi:hypothetical protein
MTLSAAAQDIVATVGCSENAVEPRRFPPDRAAVDKPGMYAWWSDDEARTVLGEEIDAELPPLLYVGQAGATKWPSGKRSSATLKSRVGGQHIRGNARSSTFRLTISSLLLHGLGLVPLPGGNLDATSNSRASAWIADHLRVAIAPYEDRDTLGLIEAEVVTHLNPPLNLGQCLPSNARRRLTELRRAIPR